MERVQAANCFDEQDNFPKVLGGINDITAFNTIEIASDGMIGVGGYSLSSDFTYRTGSRSIVALLNPSGTYSWNRRIFSGVTTQT